VIEKGVLKKKTKTIAHYGLEFHYMDIYIYRKVEKFIVLILYMGESC
jgi:hypothetical protein